MIDKEYVKVYCCADCAHYEKKQPPNELKQMWVKDLIEPQERSE